MKSIYFLGLSLMLFLGACAEKEDNLATNQAAPPASVPTEVTPSSRTNFTYLALGDSYTIGEAVSPSLNFPQQLVSQLKKADLIITDKIVAKTGWTTSDLILSINSSVLAPEYDFVTLLIGVNNQYRGYNINTYRAELIELLQKSMKYAGGKPARVFVLSIPDYSVTPFAGTDFTTTSRIKREIDAYNQINKQEADNFNINYLDITPISREAKSQPHLIASDGLHPSADMYQAWVSLLAPLVASRLR